MPRLLWIHANFVTGKQPGNCRPTHQLAAWLDRGWHIDLICTSRSYLGDALDEGSDELQLEAEGGLTIHRLPVPAADLKAREYVNFSLAAFRYASTLPCPDLVFASSPTLPQLLPALLVAARCRRPYILEIRDLWPVFLEHSGQLEQPLVLGAMRWLEALTYRCADGCVTVAPAYAQYIMAMGVDHSRICIAPTGADPRLARLCAAEREQSRAELGLNSDDVLVLYAGSFSWAYAVQDLVQAAADACAQEPRIIWAFAGNGSGRQHIEQAAATHERIRFLGSLSRDAVASVLAAADIALASHSSIPILDITISGKVFDYMAAALPIVSLQDGQTGALVRKAQCGVVLEQNSPDQITKAVLQLAALPTAERQSIGQCGREWALSTLHAGAMAELMVDYVETVVNEGRRASPARLLRAAVGAGRDVLVQRSTTVLAKIYGETLAETVASSFRAWLKGRDAGQGATTRAAQPEHWLPLILSPRLGTDHATFSRLHDDSGLPE